MDTVLSLFNKAISKWGIPHRCREDRGGENVQVAEWMINYIEEWIEEVIFLAIQCIIKELKGYEEILIK